MVQQRRYKCVSSRSIHAEQDLCASSTCASSSGSLSTNRHLQQEADRTEEGCAAQQGACFSDPSIGYKECLCPANAQQAAFFALA